MAAEKGNKYHLLRENNGADPAYETAEAMAEKAIEYFELCDKEKRKPKMVEAALFLGFASRQSLYDYEKKQDFSYIIKKIRSLVESGYEDLLQDGKATAIFALKNMGWSDKQEIDHTSKGEAIGTVPVVQIQNPHEAK